MRGGLLVHPVRLLPRHAPTPGHLARRSWPVLRAIHVMTARAIDRKRRVGDLRSCVLGDRGSRHFRDQVDNEARQEREQRPDAFDLSGLLALKAVPHYPFSSFVRSP
jgi:hypothetical protein